MSTDDTSFQSAGDLPPRPPTDETAFLSPDHLPPREPPAGPMPDGLQEFSFLSRLRNLLQLHNEISKSRPAPPMWGFLQGGVAILALVAATAVNHSLIAAEGDQDLAFVAFVIVFLLIALAPTGILYLGRRTQTAILRQNLEEHIGLTVRTYSSEVEHCGGVQVLADRVELEALIHVLQHRLEPEPERP